MIFVASNALQEVNGDTCGDTFFLLEADTPNAVMDVLQDPHGYFPDWRTVDRDRLVMTIIGRRSDGLWVSVPISLFERIFQVCNESARCHALDHSMHSSILAGVHTEQHPAHRR